MKPFVIDNYLSENDFKFLKKAIVDDCVLPLFLQTSVGSVDIEDGIFFTHLFFDNGQWNSPHRELLFPILNKLNPSEIIRIQLNLYPKTFFIKKHSWHVDRKFSHKGCILYLNTNNGRTIIRNSIKAKSVENRALFFDPSMEHRSTTCTDKEFRSNIIINYQ